MSSAPDGTTVVPAQIHDEGSVADGTTVSDAGGAPGADAPSAAPQVAKADAPSAGKPAVDQLEREGDIAADYLEELLDIADLDGDIDLDVENDRAIVSIVGADLQDLVGAGGRGLDALQELTRLAVLRETGERSRLMLDIAGTRARRRVELSKLGADAAERARSGGEPVRLAPMNPFERKVVHDAVAAAGLRSESEGVEPDRRVVVYPA
jgi:spoIIIJ-associated protein